MTARPTKALQKVLTAIFNNMSNFSPPTKDCIKEHDAKSDLEWHMQNSEKEISGVHNVGKICGDEIVYFSN